MERVTALELMDDPAVDPAELARNFDDIERANRWFGGRAPVLREVFASAAESLLDVGCGSGDIARALRAEARRRGRRLDVVGLDHSQTVLAIARARSQGDASLRFVHGDGTALPFPDRSFDIVTCNLALHHFEPDEAVAVLREMRRVARTAPLVCDLLRSKLAHAAARLYVSLLATSPLTRNDAPLSVRRAYTPVEAEDLARRAGWRAPVAKPLPFFRLMLSDGA
jgi:ubiquinone/menaquinone biosynthesis C-methylase UbiE